MIKLTTINHKHTYELSDIIKMYYGKVEIDYFDENALEYIQSILEVGDTFLVSRLEDDSGSLVCISELYDDKGHMTCTETVCKEADEDIDKQIKRCIKKSMYKLLSNAFSCSFPWGILTGIRPIKLVHEMFDKGFDEVEIEEKLSDSFLISNNRVRLAMEIAEIERRHIYPVNPKAVSIYVGIPFCPTRCHYCSFTSNSIKSCGHYIEEYLESLISEISQTAIYLKERAITAQTIYIGGGTPTSLSAEQLRRLIDCINICFGGGFEEFTCEAGRPDTIDAEKLKVLKQGGITRLSINPQTMNEETLKTIGRLHSVMQVIESFELARKHGFDNINMDLIIGLPGEGAAHIKKTMAAVSELNPESITIHTMAIKRASILHEGRYSEILKANSAEEMMEYAKSHMKKIKMKPYYLYRQKHMLQNLENIGFCKPGYECIYNMQIIEEKQTNIAFGADAVTKAVFLDENRIERQHNIKDLKLYIERVNDMVEAKLKLLKELWETRESNNAHRQ
ncbi:MAG: coproporphyrinogen dehydrogenase HemZ [Bacillota bacterium]